MGNPGYVFLYPYSGDRTRVFLYGLIQVSGKQNAPRGQALESVSMKLIKPLQHMPSDDLPVFLSTQCRLPTTLRLSHPPYCDASIMSSSLYRLMLTHATS